MPQPLDPTRTFDEAPRPDSLAAGLDHARPDDAAACPLELLEEIARGGMGAILRARDTAIGRDVAVKVLLEDHRGRPELTRRFLEEARIAGRLQHPGVVPVYALGQMPDGRPYFTMKLIKGRTLTALLAERQDPAADRPRFLAVFEQVCQTLAYAHARGVIHRDLKPSNVMVGAYGEVQVMDWGLAKVLTLGGADKQASRERQRSEGISVIQTPRVEDADSGEAGTETRAGSVLGTPAYMAPEQARGEVEDVDQRADVFGLGAILCEMLTGKPPFHGAGDAALKKARRGDLDEAFGRLDGCGADAELIGLAKRCLAAKPEGRLPDAGALSAAVTAYRESVERRLRAAEVARAAAQARAAAERRARRLNAALAAAVLLLVVLGGGGWLWLHGQSAARLAENSGAVKEALGQAAALREQARAAENTPGLSLLERARDQSLRAKALVESGPADAVLAARASMLLAEVEAEADQRRQSRSHYLHANSLSQFQGKQDEAAAEWRKAIELDPNIAGAHNNIGNFLSKQGKVDEAIAECRKAVELMPDEAMIRFDLGGALQKQGKTDEAIACYRKAVELDPKLADAHAKLGIALQNQGKTDEAFASCRKAVELDTKIPAAHACLGVALQNQGKTDEAIACYGKAIELAPAYAYAHYNLGIALEKQGKADEAAAEYHRVWWTQNTAQGAARSQICVIRARQGRLEEVRADWQKILEHNPPDHDTWYGYAELCLFLGREDEYGRARAALLASFGDETDPQVAERTSRACLLLPWTGEDLRRASALADRAAADTKHRFHAYFESAKGLAEYRNDRPEQAIPLLREAAPQTFGPASRLVLAMALYRAGQKEEARKTLADAVAAYHWDETRAAAVDDWIDFILRREAEELIVPNLSAFLKGEYQPRDNGERLELIDPCRFRKRYLSASRLYADALAADPKLAAAALSSNRYNAACAAARAGCGEGMDAKGLDEKERAGWRKQALDWLRADLALWGKRLESDKPEDRTAPAQAMRHWQEDSDLAGLRDAAALAKLPADERDAWRKLWADVQALLDKADAKK